jgi:hypothetical protein
MNVENVIGERIAQLDNIYSYTSDIRLKALVLSQMLTLAETIGVKVIKTKEYEKDNDIDAITAFINNALAFTHAFIKRDSISSYLPGIAKMIKFMDRVRATLLYELVERGIITKFKEIQIAIDDETLKDVEGSL